MAGLSHNYILDNFKKVELDRDNVVFSETGKSGSRTIKCHVGNKSSSEGGLYRVVVICAS